jgi:hypothetical protein
MADHQEGMELRLLFSPNYEDDCRAYGNFGLMQKGKEHLLFMPEYMVDGRMKETRFLYYDERRRADYRANQEEIRRYEAKFGKAWKRSEPLREDHLP